MVMTIDEASKLTTFQLRQELVNRYGGQDIPPACFNYKELLARLVKEIVKEEKEAAQKVADALTKKALEEREQQKLIREQRKAEALARSKARTQNKDYFQSKREANECNSLSTTMTSTTDDTIEVVEEEEPHELLKSHVDVFSSAPISRPRIHIR